MPDNGVSRTHVLVVSDDPAVRDEMRYGAPDGVEVSFALDSRQAIEAMLKAAPSVVVVDLQTGSAGGYNLAKRMSQTRSLSKVPVLMLLERPQDAWLARQSGAARVRVKPVDAASLIEQTLELVSG